MVVVCFIFFILGGWCEVGVFEVGWRGWECLNEAPEQRRVWRFLPSGIRRYRLYGKPTDRRRFHSPASAQLFSSDVVWFIGQSCDFAPTHSQNPTPTLRHHPYPHSAPSATMNKTCEIVISATRVNVEIVLVVTQ